MAKERGEPPTLALLVVLSPITPRPFSIDDVLKTPCFFKKAIYIICINCVGIHYLMCKCTCIIYV